MEVFLQDTLELTASKWLITAKLMETTTTGSLTQRRYSFVSSFETESALAPESIIMKTRVMMVPLK